MAKEHPYPFLTDPNGKEHLLSEPVATIGRALECDLVVASKSVSREHARLHHEGHRWFIVDLDSTNGTFLNGERVMSRLEILDGDNLKVGEVSFVFHDPDSTVSSNPRPELEVDIEAGEVRVNRKAVSLSTKEFMLLVYLHQRRGQVCSKDDIRRAVWPEYEAGGVFDYQIENLVRRLRMRIESDAAEPQLLLTMRGLGYKLTLG